MATWHGTTIVSGGSGDQTMRVWEERSRLGRDERESPVHHHAGRRKTQSKVQGLRSKVGSEVTEASSTTRRERQAKLGTLVRWSRSLVLAALSECTMVSLCGQ